MKREENSLDPVRIVSQKSNRGEFITRRVTTPKRPIITRHPAKNAPAMK
jgi:hypothetical protein